MKEMHSLDANQLLLLVSVILTLNNPFSGPSINAVTLIKTIYNMSIWIFRRWTQS